ncbi:MAG: AmmeMemoRadiSam system radical SAM enzyme [Oscillospiraceae bacterium]|nr:AmmeMemoRadiSam system radical SAM enzyme [Oscillospiraceae bacterium]
MKTATCTICPHRCRLEDHALGLCRARQNQDGKVASLNYGKLTSIALDPIEKKPLRRFHPGSLILSVGSFGCNLRCPFCQNHEISMAGREAETEEISPMELVRCAQQTGRQGNIGIAFTYNEPLIGYEFVYDTSVLAKENGLETVLVTNGYVEEAPLRALLPYLSALNIDLKAFRMDSYRKLDGELKPVLRTIEQSAKACHVEVTTLIVPGLNDTDGEMDGLSRFLSKTDPDIPLHISRFFPRYRMSSQPPTSRSAVFHLADIARRHLKYVYTGNV